MSTLGLAPDPAGPYTIDPAALAPAQGGLSAALPALPIAAPGTEAVHVWNDTLVLNDRGPTNLGHVDEETPYRFWCDRISTGAAPEATTPSSPKVGGVGTTPRRGSQGSRVITYEGRIFALNTAWLRAATTELRAAFFDLSGPRPMRIRHHEDYRPERYVFTGRGTVPVVNDALGPSLNTIPTPYQATFVLGIELFDPRIYLDLPLSLEASAGEAGGIAIPMAIPAVLPALPKGQTTVEGFVDTTVPTPPTIRIDGPIDRPTLTDLTHDRVLALDLTISQGDWVDIDMADGTVTDSRGTQYPGAVAWPESSWWTPARRDLHPGPLTVRLDGRFLAAPAGARITYRPAVP